MPGNRDEETFDGSFLLHEPYPSNMKEAPRYYAEYLPAHVTPLPKEEWPEVYRAQAAKYTTDQVVCYCNTCYSGPKEVGVDIHHLAQLLFPV